MRLLLDSHVVIWFIAGTPRIGSRTKAMLLDRDTELFVSTASLWELSAKASRGGFPLASPVIPKLLSALARTASILDINTSHVEALELLPRHHNDPFDRMLIAQAMTADLTLVTCDRAIAAYSVLLHDASH